MTDVDLIPSAFCLVSDVHNVMGQDLKADRDNQIKSLINLFSTMCEGSKFCNREFEIKERTEFFDGAGELDPCSPRKSFSVKAPPIDVGEDLDIWDDPDRAYTDNFKLNINVDYRVNHRAGLIRSVTCFNPEYQNLKIIYTGGLVKYDTDNDEIISPNDLRYACALQVSHWYKIRHEPGATSVSMPYGGFLSIPEPTQLLPIVWSTLLNYKRHGY